MNHGQHWFFGVYGFDINKAYDISEKNPRYFVDTKDHVKDLIPAGGKIRQLGVLVDVDKAAQSDTSLPLIFAKLNEGKDDEAIVMIGGHHQLYKARFMENRETMEAIVLTRKQAMEISLNDVTKNLFKQKGRSGK